VPLQCRGWERLVSQIFLFFMSVPLNWEYMGTTFIPHTDGRICLGLGGSTGPIVAGLILRFTSDWRWVSRVNSFLAIANFVFMILSFPELNFDREFALRHPSTRERKTFVELLSFTNGYDREASVLKSLRRSIAVMRYPALPWAILTFGIPMGLVSA
jgi:hypothetical protein